MACRRARPAARKGRSLRVEPFLIIRVVEAELALELPVATFAADNAAEAALTEPGVPVLKLGGVAGGPVVKVMSAP